MKLGQWIGLLALIAAIYILWSIQQLLLLMFVGIVFATALNRLVRWMGKYGIPRGAASIFSIVGLLLLLTLFVAIIVPPFLDQFQLLTELVPQGLNQLRLGLDWLVDRLPGGAADLVPNFNELFNQLQPFVSGLANNFFRAFSGFFNVGISFLFVLMLTIMLLLNPHPYRQGFLRLVPSFYRRRADEILTLCEEDLVGWIIGTLINMVVIAIVSGIVLHILGVKLVLANALVAGLMEAIPNLGPVLSTIAPVAIALIDSPVKALGVLIAYILIQQLEQFLLVPVVMGQQVSLLPAVTLLAQFAFASFFGFLGLFLAIPLVIIVRILLREVVIRDVLDQWTNPEFEHREQESHLLENQEGAIAPAVCSSGCSTHTPPHSATAAESPDATHPPKNPPKNPADAIAETSYIAGNPGRSDPSAESGSPDGSSEQSN
ncbi:AI-2E family transporter [Thermoleptolyngbya sp. M55_K2018_002]|uniref:AI-2E family transporter n=1 Tax=Thermoleptolyngbya sp. M55_K2018_002 TaxID=2747808 RepID=UPI001A0A0228|nr:AI-2E family transporter [Thermoleptolyngbya sp. M55_K2018_002]HIK39145.1 AI-2E family transporter [Thermoleptolyngbya sp. M55_K2018_002]